MCSLVCESPSKSGSYLKCFIYLRFLSKSAIQYYAVTSVSQREMKNCAMKGLLTYKLEAHTNTIRLFLLSLLSLQNWICCLQMNNHTSLTIFSKQWTHCYVDISLIVNVIHCLKVHSLHCLNIWMFTDHRFCINKRCLKLSGNLTWTYMVLQNVLKSFHTYHSHCFACTH